MSLTQLTKRYANSAGSRNVKQYVLEYPVSISVDVAWKRVIQNALILSILFSLEQLIRHNSSLIIID